MHVGATSPSQDQQDGRSKQPEKAAKAACRATDAEGSLCLVLGCITAEFSRMKWERWSASFTTSVVRVESCCGTSSHVKSSDSVPGSPEQTRGGGSHEDSGSLCVVFLPALHIRCCGLRREKQTEAACSTLLLKQAIHRGNLARKASPAEWGVRDVSGLGVFGRGSDENTVEFSDALSCGITPT